ncbi:MAG TPA: hypothetical protein VMS99_14390 [Acidimicrobiia bacterium]|nr:hypothetical protein [Acidimicrobiia bacterium]
MKARVLLLLGVLLPAACGVAGDDGGGEVPGDETTTSTSSTIDTTTTSETQLPEEDTVEAAITDLAGRLDIGEGDIEVTDVRDVQWPDGALGCPEEGKMYTQAVVDGTQVLLGANDRIYDYHAGSDGEPFLCASDQKDGGYDFVPPPGFDE